MKCTLLATILILSFVTQTSAATIKRDSSVIFVTRQQFDKDSGAFSCNCVVQEKPGFFWQEFYYNAEGPVRIKKDNGEKIKFAPGSIVGFSVNDKKFVYLPLENMYYAKLGEISAISLLLGPSSKTTYIGYIKPQTGRFRRLTRRHILADFQDDRNLQSKLLSLNKKINDYWFFSFRHKDYLAFKKIIAGIESNGRRRLF